MSLDMTPERLGDLKATLPDNPGFRPEQNLADVIDNGIYVDALFQNERDSMERDRLLELAQKSPITTLTRYGLQTVAWPVGGVIGGAVFGGVAIVGVFALSKGVEALTGSPLPQGVPPETFLPPTILDFLHQSADQIGTISLSILDKVPPELVVKGQEAVLSIKSQLLSATAAISAGAVGARSGSSYASERADRLGEGLGTAVTLQALKIQSRLPLRF